MSNAAEQRQQIAADRARLKPTEVRLQYPCDETLTDQEVDAEISRLGIDMKPAFQRLHKMIEAQRAKAQFASAKAKRATKLEGAASEEDLQSLLDDLETLEAIQELRNDSESK